GYAERMKKYASVWKEIAGVSDERVAEMVRGDAIDILVDLAGHTAGNRMRVFARRAAPVQVTYLGYPVTSGLGTMDWRITDGEADPEGSERFYSEKLVRLPRTFLTYRPTEGVEVSDLPADRGAGSTFGSFNNLAKVTEKVIATW